LNEEEYNNNVEGMDVTASGEQVRAAGSLGDLPLAVVTRSPDEPMIDLPGLTDTLEQVWQELQTEMADLSTNSIHLISKKSGHRIIILDYQLVIEGILWVLEQAAE
jgi:hypothetical protein